jgi:hypothetical protein
MDDVPVSREVLGEKMASPHDHLGEVIRRRTGEVSWEILDRESRLTVVGGLPDREEALRNVRGWERLSQREEGGLEGRLTVH